MNFKHQMVGPMLHHTLLNMMIYQNGQRVTGDVKYVHPENTIHFHKIPNVTTVQQVHGMLDMFLFRKKHHWKRWVEHQWSVGALKLNVCLD